MSGAHDGQSRHACRGAEQQGKESVQREVERKSYGGGRRVAESVQEAVDRHQCVEQRVEGV